MTSIAIIDIIFNVILSYLVYAGELWPMIHLVTLVGILADAFSLYQLSETLNTSKIAAVPQFIITTFTVLDAFFDAYIVWFCFVAGMWFASWQLLIIGSIFGILALSLDWYFIYLLNFKIEQE